MSLPYIEIPWPETSLPIHPFGLIVGIGIVVGALVMQRYATRRGMPIDDVRSLVTWVAVSGFLGAHFFHLLAYDRARIAHDPLVVARVWEGISSYGGFVGGAAGFALCVWRRRLRWGLAADTAIVGLLLAFSIGRIGCALVHDHVGAVTDSFLGVDYPRAALAARGLLGELGSSGEVIRAHNLGLLELLYLIPVNVVVLVLAFKDRLRTPGALALLTGILYAPVRFGLDFLRPTATDPLYAGLTFAHWCSVATFAVCVAMAVRLRGRSRIA